MDPFTSFAPFVAWIIPANTAPSNPTAIMPFAKLGISTKLKAMDIAAKPAIAIVIAKMVAVNFAVCSVFDIVVTFFRAATNIRNAAAKAAPFFISSSDSIPASLHIPTINVIENDMDKSIKPSLSVLEPANLVTLESNPINTINAVAKTAPFSISSADNKSTSLHTPTINAIETVSLLTIFPNVSANGPAILAATPIKTANDVNASAKAAPCNICSADNVEISFTTTAIRPSATASLTIIVVIPSVFSNPLLSPTFPMILRNMSNSAIKIVRPANPCTACSKLIDPINFTIAAKAIRATPIWIRPVFKPSILARFSPIDIDASDILLTA